MVLYEYELGKAADIVARDLFALKPGETFVITADTESNPDVVNATARAAFSLGAKPMVIWTASPLGVGEAADPMLPVEALTGALKGADAWVEYNNQWLLYSTPYNVAMKQNKKLRHLNLVGMNPDMMIRCIGRIDFATLQEFQETFSAMLTETKHVRITTPAGEDLELEHKPGIPIRCRMGYAHKPGSEMLAGQISSTPDFDSINGTIVFDGSLVPPCGKLEEPIRLTINAGTIVKVDGGVQAREFETWMNGFNHPQMKRLAHLSYGVNPGARLTGDIVEDERVWGSTEWGIGSVPGTIVPPDGFPAPSHCDGICMNSSVWLDGEQVLDTGTFIEPQLVQLAKKLGKG